MTRQEVRKVLTKLNLSNSEEKVMLKILDATFRKNSDNPELMVNITSTQLQKAGRIGQRQLYNVIDQLQEKELILDVKTGSNVRCRLNIARIVTFPHFDPAPAKKVKADRAQKAREKRAEVRELSRVIDACKDAADKDRAELLTKMILLQDVKDKEIKRAMMQWDIDRIQHAKANAEAIQQ